jgi:hypothetical protein
VKGPTKSGFDKYGFVDGNLNLVIRPEFDSYSYDLGFVDGIVEVWNHDTGLRGYINREGEWVRSWGEGRNLTFMFKDTSALEIAQTLNVFGAVPLKGRHVFLFSDPVKGDDQASRTWIYPSEKQVLLTIGLEDNMKSLEVGMLIEDVRKWWNLESRLLAKDPRKILIGFRSSVALYVTIAYGTAAEEALNEFALWILKAHPGGVCNWDRNQTWTLEEIKSNLNSKGVPFLRRLEKPTSPSQK